MKKVSISHLTSVHERNDVRIFHKMCKSLSKKYDVNLIVADGKGDEIIENIKIIDIGKPNSRINRILFTTKKIFEKAKEIDSEVYHLHDPELIPIGLKLKKLGKKVIFDSHEDVPKQIISKHYLNKLIRIILSKIYSIYEKHTLKQFDMIISATPHIKKKFLKESINSIDINNFPILSEFINLSPDFNNNNICYIGSLYYTRGIRELIKAIEKLNVNLIIAGEFHSSEFEKEIKSMKGWEKVIFKGYVDRKEIKKILENSSVGIVTLHPTESYLESYPVKMFEYMAAGLPVVASNFPLWKEIIEKNYCGICVNPFNIKEITDAIDCFIKNKDLAKQLGKNGKIAVSTNYNWEIEEEKLFKVYEDLLS